MATFDRQKLLDVANAEVGYLEKKSNSNLDNKTANSGYNNYTKYARDFDNLYPDFYNGKKNGYAWCDIFVDWCFVKAYGVANALTLLGQPKKSCGAGCTWSAKYFKQIGCFYTKPEVGDQIFFKDSSGDPCHTGIVYKVDSSKVYTIEGNTSSASGVVANGGAVAKKSYSLNYNRIYGYGRPKYNDNYGKEINKPVEPNTTSPKPTTSTTPKTVKATGVAKYFDKTLSGTYKVSWSNINVRNGAGTSNKLIVNIPKGTKVQCYGYYSTVNLVKWLYVQFTYNNVTYTGFICKNGLTK
jgi:hypothetical protein